jgi:hypothetical protein
VSYPFLLCRLRLAQRRSLMKASPYDWDARQRFAVATYRTGKVRDIYAVGDDRVLLLTTDRISASTS